MLFDVETFKKTYPDWFKPFTIGDLISVIIIFFLILLILGICIKYFGRKLILSTIKIDIVDKIVKVNNEKLDAGERKNLAAELKNKIHCFNPSAALTSDAFKQSYTNINLEFDGEEYNLKEGYRYMPIEEIYYVLDLIHASPAGS